MKPAYIYLMAFAMMSSAIAQTADRRFNDWDKNKDGRLTKSELPEGPRRNFEKVDTNKDGFISLQEHVLFLTRGQNRLRRQPPPAVITGYAVKVNIPYAGSDNPRQMLDLALPQKKSTKPRPVLAFIHGGGWRNGSKNGGLRRIQTYLQAGGYVGVSIGYRLTGEVQWPAQIHDCKAAIRWLKANAKKYNLDPNRIAVHGTSAGGHLVAMLGVTGGMTDMEGQLGDHLKTDSRVACVVDYFGPTELLTMDDHPGKMKHNAMDSPESKLIGGAIQEHKDKTRHASPITHVSKDDAPILICHGTDDQLVPYPQSVDFHAKLKKAGVDSTLITVNGAGHGLRGKRLEEIIKTFLARHLMGKTTKVEDETIPN
ncbi:MAG: carboxylesterase [Verrucomicrobiales bacterium]|nr:carboxylesterase [Verrucomicrobiales bacterium]|tara:strand:+ start:6135 stop:7241 length:1107 start_codon:yes stop_codon:yes gene_type:complete